MPRLAALTALLVLLDTCPKGTGLGSDLLPGTWGGENAGVVVGDTTMHLHLGCTIGNAPRPRLTNGRFEVAGRHNITAHPVDLGVFHPGVFTGEVSGHIMRLTVRLTDTSVTLGPVSVELGRDPRMGPCPICRNLKAES